MVLVVNNMLMRFEVKSDHLFPPLLFADADPSYCGSGPHRHKSVEEHLIESEKAWLVVASSIHMGAALHTQNTQIRIRSCVRHQQPGPA